MREVACDLPVNKWEANRALLYFLIGNGSELSPTCSCGQRNKEMDYHVLGLSVPFQFKLQ